MEIKIKCDNDQSTLSARVTEVDGEIVILAEPCPKCIARNILMAEDAPWLRNKLLKEGGEKLRELRRSRGFTQAQMAEELDTSTSQVSQLERGARGLGPDLLMRYCNYFGISPSEFEPSKTLGSYPPIIQMIIDAILDLPKPEQTRILADIQERFPREGDGATKAK